MAKLKDSDVTTVLLFADFQMEQQVFRAADLLDYHPEWVFTGYSNDDIEGTARFLNAGSPDQMKHVFGLGIGAALRRGNRRSDQGLVRLVLGQGQGRLLRDTGRLARRAATTASASPGPKLTPARFQQALFSIPAGGGAASNQVESFMGGFGRTPGLPVRRVLPGGLDYTVIWWNPTEVGTGKLFLDDGTGRFMYIDGAKRYHAGQWTKGEPKLFDPNNSFSQFDELPASDVVPDYPCRGCPSAS